MKTDAPAPSVAEAPSFGEALRRVLGMQDKLHRWSKRDATARFADLFNLVADPAFLLIAWERVSTNTGARSAGIDGLTARAITAADQVEGFLAGLRAQLKSGTFAPSPVKQRLIPKSPGKYRRLGIPTVADRVVQASLVLVLEPIFEADFHPSSYGFRPNRRTMDAVAEIQMFASRSYEWVLEADIAACFDEINHAALLGRVRRRIGDKRVLALIKAFLKAGVLSEDQAIRENNSGTPQGGILSPLLANIALEVLDEHFARLWQTQSATRVDRSRRRRHGQPTYRLVRYADDFVVLVSGSREHAEAIHDQVAAVLAPIGLQAVTGEDRRGSYRRGVRLPRIPHPAAPEAGHEPAIRLHLPRQEVVGGGETEGEGDHHPGHEQSLERAAGPNQPGPARLDQLLPLRGRERDLPLSQPLHLVADRRMDTPQTPENELEEPATQVLPRQPVVAAGRRCQAVRTRTRRDPALPLPGRHPATMAQTQGNQLTIDACGEPGARGTRTPGSGGGPGKRNGRNTVTAPRADLTSAGDALDRCRRRVQQDIHGHRGRKTDPLYRARRTLHTGADLLTDKQTDRLDALFAVDEHVQVEATWGIYQRMIAAYREPDRSRGRELMAKLIDSSATASRPR